MNNKVRIISYLTWVGLIGYFVIYPHIEFSGPGPTRAMSDLYCSLLWLGSVVALAIFLSLFTLIKRNKLDKKTKLIGISPFLGIITQIMIEVILISLEPTRDEQRHQLIYQIKLDQLQPQKVKHYFHTDSSISSGNLRRKNQFIFDYAPTIYKGKVRRIEIESEFFSFEEEFDIPIMPEVCEWTDWKAVHEKVKTRYKVVKN